MPVRQLEGGFYHIFNRGFNKQQIFYRESDYERFFKKLESLLLAKANVQLISYCILPNHFHFLISAEEGEDLQEIFGRLQNSYGKYFNIKYEKKGQVFEGRFKANLISDEKYFEKCQAYVSFNAQKHGIVENYEDWPYSSIHQIFNPGVELNPGVEVKIGGFSTDIFKYKNFEEIEFEF